jgi:vacuolar-type H+-ATPase subunit E/Vma4
MPLNDLLAELDRQASERIEHELSRAQERAREILARAQERLEAERQRALEGHRDERRDEDERRLAAARREASRRVYEARRRLLDRVFAAAREQLEAWGDRHEPPTEALTALEAALPYLDEAEAVLFAPSAWRPALERRVGKSIDLLEPQESDGPVLALASSDGRRIVDLSPAPRLEHARDELSIALLRELGAPTWSPTAEI